MEDMNKTDIVRPNSQKKKMNGEKNSYPETGKLAASTTTTTTSTAAFTPSTPSNNMKDPPHPQRHPRKSDTKHEADYFNDFEKEDEDNYDSKSKLNKLKCLSFARRLPNSNTAPRDTDFPDTITSNTTTNNDMILSQAELLYIKKMICKDVKREGTNNLNAQEHLQLLKTSSRQINTDFDDDSNDHHNSAFDDENIIIDTVFGKSKFTTRTLEEDSFGFMISSPLFSIPWWTGFLVALLETSVFILILVNSVDVRGSRENPLGIPASVSPQVAITQFIAMFIAVASQDDVRSAIKYYYEGYEEEGIGSAFRGSKSYHQWLFAVITQFLEGALGILATFFLIVTSDAVVDLLLNFTAVEFVTLLDNNAFSIAREGFLGKRNMLETEIIAETEYSLPRARKITPRGQIMSLVATFALMMMGWIIVYTDQLRGRYTVKTLYVQFEDSLNPGLGAYSGFFHLDVAPGSIRISRIRYNAANREGFFGYCESAKVWTFSFQGKDACDNPVVKSSITNQFDIIQVAERQWYVTNNANEQLYFPMDDFHLGAGCIRDQDCGGVGRGICADNHCYCEDEYFGVLCLYTRAEICETIAINEEFALFQGNREFSSEFNLLRDDGGTIIEAYHHPIYYYASENSELEVMLYMGLRWGLTAALGDSIDDLREQMSQQPFHAVHDLPMLEFYTEIVHFNSPLDTSAPVIQTWKKVEPTALGSTSQVGPITTRLLCGICSEGNPCRYDNTCGPDGRCIQTCSLEGTCVCGNGAYGRLCQTTPLGDGKCDSYFNVPSYKYDGGDCCEATCINVDTNTCGYINADSIEHVNIGYPECVDPLVIEHECAGKTCWVPNGRSLPLLSAENPASVYLSANGRIIAVAEPALDAVRVFDHDDSRWIQRGSILEGPVGSNFGKRLVLETLPGAIVGRRIGRVPIVVGIGLNGIGKAGIRVVRWEPNDIDWRAVGDVLDICVDAPNTCDLRDLDIARKEDRLTLSVVRADNFALVYRHTLSETGRNPWVLQFYANGSEPLGDLTDSGKETYRATSVSPFGFLTSGNTVIFSYGVSIEASDISDDKTFVNEGNLMSNAQNMRHYPGMKLNFAFYNPHVPSELISIGEQLNWEKNVTYNDISSVQLSPDSTMLMIVLHVDSRDTPPGAQIEIITMYEFIDLKLTATWARNFTTADLVGSQLDGGITSVKFSADASSFAIRERLADGNSVVRTKALDRDRFEFLPVGLPREDIGGDMSLNYDGTIFFQPLVGRDQGFSVVPKCSVGMSHYRLAITLDEKPELLSWTMETYQNLGPLFFGEKLIRSCDSCYFDNDRFGKGLVADDICVANEVEVCLRLRFQARSGFRPGAGLVLYREGKEVFAQIGNNTSEQYFLAGNPDECEMERVECGEDESRILLALRFDTYPEQTSWTMKDNSENIIGWGDNYTADFSSQTELVQMCGPKGADYTFVLEDSSENNYDGICCSKGNGGYDLYVDFVIVYHREGERSFRFDTVVFNRDGVVEEPIPITFEFQLDDYPDETQWQVELPGSKLLHATPFYVYTNQRNALVSKTLYLSPGQEYVLVLEDSYKTKDGFCCTNGNGYYRIYDSDFSDVSKLLASGSGEFTGSWHEVPFTVPARGSSNHTYVPISLAPTPSPVITSSNETTTEGSDNVIVEPEATPDDVDNATETEINSNP